MVNKGSFNRYSCWSIFIRLVLADTTVTSSCPESGPFEKYVTTEHRFGAHNIRRALWLPNDLYGSFWGASQAFNDYSILNMSGLADYFYLILEPISSSYLLCGLGDGIFFDSAVIMSINIDQNKSRDKKRLRRR